MPKKKTPNENKPKVNNPNVLGLRAAVVEQSITDTLETNYMPFTPCTRWASSQSPAPSLPTSWARP